MNKLLKSIYDLLFGRPVKIDPEEMLRSKERYEELAKDQNNDKNKKPEMRTP